MDEKQMHKYVMDCLKAGSIKVLNVDARGDKRMCLVDIEVPFEECETAETPDEAWERVRAYIAGATHPDYHPHVNCPCVMPEPHTCPTCDGYGYVNAIIFSDKPTERRDIPCPDCEAE